MKARICAVGLGSHKVIYRGGKVILVFLERGRSRIYGAES